jgi:hypothetical protein
MADGLGLMIDDHRHHCGHAGVFQQMSRGVGFVLIKRRGQEETLPVLD